MSDDKRTKEEIEQMVEMSHFPPKFYTQMFDECFNVGVDACVVTLERVSEQYAGVDEYIRLFIKSLSNQLEQLKKPLT